MKITFIACIQLYFWLKLNKYSHCYLKYYINNFKIKSVYS